MIGRGDVDNWGSVVGRGGMVDGGGQDGGSMVDGVGQDGGSMVDGVGHKRGSMDSMMGNCVMGHRVSNNRGSMMHSMVSQRSSVEKRGSMVDGVRDNWSMGNRVMGNSVMGNRVGDGVDCMVGRDNLAMSTVGHG